MPLDETGWPLLPVEPPPAELTPPQRCRILADVIERGDYGFDMNRYTVPDPTCGTAGCIAGVAGAVFPSLPRHSYQGEEEVDEFAVAELLGLRDGQIGEMFMPWDHVSAELEPYKITRSMAARCLRRFAETGEIVWERDP